MQPQMVAGIYQNPLGTHNSFLGSTSGGNPLPWNVNKVMHHGTKILIGIILH